MSSIFQRHLGHSYFRASSNIGLVCQVTEQYTVMCVLFMYPFFFFFFFYFLFFYNKNKQKKIIIF
jgi:hypothetical protein